MTRNNLGEHLSWLLANTALSTPNAPSLPAVSVDLNTPDNTGTPTSLPSQLDTSHLGSFGGSANLSNPTRQSLPHVAAHAGATARSASHLSEDLDESSVARGSMGRLVSSSAVKKRSLLVQQEQSQDQLLTPDSTSTPGRLQRAYAASLRTPGTGAPAHRKASPQRRPQRLVPRGQNLADGGDCETVDLTGSDDLLSSDSNAFTFDEDATIWGAGHASRPEPSSGPRGKKRKSGEMSQIHQPEPDIDPFDEEFPDIFEIVGDTSIESLIRTTPKSSRKRKLPSWKDSKDPMCSESDERRSPGPTTTLPPGTKRSPTKSPSKLASPEAPSAPIRCTPSPLRRHSPMKIDEEDEEDSEEEASPGPVVSRPRTRRDSRVIQDSDEEWTTPPTHNISIVTVHSSISRGRKHSSPRHSREQSPAIIAFDTPSKPRTHKPEASPPDLSPVRKKPSSQASVLAEGLALRSQPTPTTSQTPVTSQTIPSLDDDEKAAILTLFLSRPSILQEHRCALEDKLAQNRNDFRAALTSGQMVQTNALKREKERLTGQLAALNVLSDEHQSYEYLVLEKDVLVEKMMEAYDQDMDADESNRKMEELVAEVFERESTLVTTLLKAGITDVTMFEDCPPPKTHASRAESTVQATQHGHNTSSQGLSRRHAQGTNHNSQVIKQTQISQPHHSASESGFRAVDDTPFPRSSGRERGKAISSDLRVRDGGAAAHQGASSTRSAVRSGPAPTMNDDLYDPDDEEALFGEDSSSGAYHSFARSGREPSNAKGRKTPVKAPKRTESFVSEDEYDDDADMLELVHDFEAKQSSSESAARGHERSVFAETSGNVPPHKPSKTVKRVTSTSNKAHFPPELMKYPWSGDVKRALKDRFRMSGFRHNQLEAINTTLAGKDAFVLMPTGGGKSLCYQLPAVVKSGKTRGITIVVSPLLSLMQDQVEHLMELHIQAVSFNGECRPEARQKVLQLLKDPSADHYIDLLYVTPEMINKSSAFRDALAVLHRNKKLARLVIDEAHCVSQWGHDFRPDYKEIGAFRYDFPNVPLMALTATATPNVIVDVRHNLGMDNCQLFTQSFNRPNLYYEVRRKEKGLVDTIAELINGKYRGQTGIVYTLSRKNSESTAEKLRGRGIAANHYHAGLEPALKEQIKKDWQKGRIMVVVATIAFGMGIDKADVRFVIHQTLPKSLEGYYQETGRAGRDGQPSECYLFYNYGDAYLLRKMIMDGEGNYDQKERQLNMLNTVSAFADNQSDCRRTEILRYFGESFHKADCQSTCDNCKSNGVFEMRDFTETAVAILQIIRSEKKLTMNQCAEAMRGLNKKKYLKASESRYFGFSKKLEKHEICRVIDRLAAEGALKEDNVFNNHARIAVQYFSLDHKAHSYLSGRGNLMLAVQVKGGDSQQSVPKANSKASRATKQTKVDASRLPPSTNVSSPPARKRKGKGKAVATHDDGSDDEVFERFDNGYARDDFVAPDDYDSFDDDFEVMERPKPKPKPKPQKGPLGPPIAQDVEMASLDEIHQDIVLAFERDAGSIVERLQHSHSLRKPIFTTQQLRAMASRWTMTLDDMAAIPGIDQEKVEKFGKRVLPKIKEYFRQYEEIMGGDVADATVQPRPPLAPAPDNFMDLVSTDDEEGMEDAEAGVQEDEDDEDDEGEESRYFDGPAHQPSPKVQRWHKEFAQASKSNAPATTSRARSSSSSRGSSKFARGGYRRGGRKYSGGSQRSRSGVSKKKTTSSKRSTATAGSSRSGPSVFAAGAATSASRSGRGGSSAAQRQRIDTMEY